MSRSTERVSTRKPLSFSTTMRNPNRIVKFLNCILPFENKILTHDIIMNVMHNVIKWKLYKPLFITRNQELNSISKSETEMFSDEQLLLIIKNSPQNHKEKGFDKGWDSRFDTFFKLPMEFGFLQYSMGNPIRISATGHMLIDAFNENPPNEEKIQNVFLNSMARYQSNNPFRKNANSNVPLILLLQVLDKLKNDPKENGDGVFRQELSLFICWPDNDAEGLYNRIKEIRAKYGFKYSDEVIYEICLHLLGASIDQQKRFKMSQICGEAVDEYIRKMRATGIVSLRGHGRFLDYNNWEIDKIKYVLEQYSNYPIFTSKEDYFAYMGGIDPQIISISSTIPENSSDLKQQTLYKIASEYDKKSVFNELKKVCKKSNSTDPLLKFIPQPVRLEFLTSIAFVQNFDNIKVKPNYTTDDEGLPVHTASGGRADIVCFDETCQSLVEVTLMCGRTDQVCNEIVPIGRHLIEEKKQNSSTFSVFIAPSIHKDTKEMAAWYKYKDNLDILTYDIEDFIKTIKRENQLADLLGGNK